MVESGIGLLGRAHLVLVDARTGEIVGFVDRDWNYQVDGYRSSPGTKGRWTGVRRVVYDPATCRVHTPYALKPLFA